MIGETGRVSPFADEGEVSCGWLWSVVGVGADRLLLPLVVISDGSGNALKGVVVVGALSMKPRIKSGTEDGVTLATIVNDGRSNTVVGQSCSGRP